MFIPRVPTVTATGASPSATRLRDHGRLQRLLRRTAAKIGDRLPGLRGRYTPDHLLEAVEAASPRAGRRRNLKHSPHLGHIVDVYV